MKGATRLALFITLFVALAAAGIAWGVGSAGVTVDDLTSLGDLPAPALVVIVALIPLFYFADMLRYRAFGRAVGEHVSWRAALDASVATFLFSWISPGAGI